jgi:hypothetical protein
VGTYVVAPPSVHPSGAAYVFEIAPDGALPEVDLQALLELPADTVVSEASGASIPLTGPSDFALRYGKSFYPEALCGMATKVLTRRDGRVKKLVSLRCWKWHCRKCAPLLKRRWMDELGRFSFRFIIRLPTATKPTTFLRRLGKPRYAHIVANEEGWLFLLDGEPEQVWEESRRAGYQLVAGD